MLVQDDRQPEEKSIFESHSLFGFCVLLSSAAACWVLSSCLPRVSAFESDL